MLESNRKLKHLNLGEPRIENSQSINSTNGLYFLYLSYSISYTAFCGVSVNMDEVVEHLATYNTQLITLDLWKSHFLTTRGLQFITKLHHLEELDLGWWYVSHTVGKLDILSNRFIFELPSLRESSLGDGLFKLLTNCPKLRKLFLSAVRGTTERDLMHIAALGKNLEQLDIMGMISLTHERVYE